MGIFEEVNARHPKSRRLRMLGIPCDGNLPSNDVYFPSFHHLTTNKYPAYLRQFAVGATRASVGGRGGFEVEHKFPLYREYTDN